MISGDVNNLGGTVSPGNSPGVLTVTGDYAQHAEATLRIEIGGSAVGSQHDQLRIEGVARLDGALEIVLLDGFAPEVGNQLDILQFAFAEGSFDTLILPPLRRGLAWDVSTLYTTGALAVAQAVPEPGTWLPGCFALAGITLLRGRSGRNT